METWHSVKLGKYTPLSTIISSNGWSVDLFAVEVGGRGYCAKSLPITLKKLGFGSKLVKSSTKTLGSTSMKSSFCIWLARNSKEWTSKDFKTKLDKDHSVKQKQLYIILLYVLVKNVWI